MWEVCEGGVGGGELYGRHVRVGWVGLACVEVCEGGVGGVSLCGGM